MNFKTLSDEDILAVVNPIMDRLMQGSTEINHSKHTQDFTERMKSIVTPERLEEMCIEYQKRIGFFQARQFVALFRRKDSVAVVWKQFMSKSEDEFVAEAVFVYRDGRCLVDHAMVF